jgi:hypothetical protein
MVAFPERDSVTLGKMVRRIDQLRNWQEGGWEMGVDDVVVRFLLVNC